MRTLCFLLFTLSTSILWSQEAALVVTTSDTAIYRWVEQMPAFTGCDPTDPDAYTCTLRELTLYLFREMQYPEDALVANQGGKAQVALVIDTLGQVQRTRLVESSGVTSLDKEALRIVRSIRDWTPGKQGDRPVRVEMVIPVTFRPELFRRKD